MRIHPDPDLSHPLPLLPRFVVLDASARMPSSCWGRYRRVAVVELDGTGIMPRMISPRAKGVKRIVTLHDKVNVGRTGRCAYRRALRDALGEAYVLNAAVLGGAASAPVPTG